MQYSEYWIEHDKSTSHKSIFEKADIRDEENERSKHIDKAEYNYNIAS